MTTEGTNSGYEYSLWLVPINYKTIQKTFKMKHIPHITVETNLKTIENCNTNKIYIVKNFTWYGKIESQYTNDPLCSWGWLCDSIDIVIKHQAHMSMVYNKHNEKITNIVPPDETPVLLECNLYYADTRSDDPSKWYLITS